MEIPRYDPEEFAEWEAPEPGRSKVVQMPGTSAAEVGDAPAGLVLDPSAAPPFDRLMALLTNDAKFKRTWERKRADLRDPSPSGYDMALANIGFAAGWSVQEVVNLCIAWRRQHGEDLKLRDDYWQRTIARARQGREQDAAVETLAGDEASREDTLVLISRIVGLTVVGWIQTGVDEPRYSLVLDDDTEVYIGTAEVVVAPDRFSTQLWKRTGKQLPPIKRDAWRRVTEQLFRIATLVAKDEGTRVQRALRWVHSYLYGAEGAREVDGGDAYKEAALGFLPFIKDGHIYVYADRLRRHVIMSAFERIEEAELRDMLRGAGFVRKPLSVRDEHSKVQRRSYYRAPVSVLDAFDHVPGDDEEPAP